MNILFYFHLLYRNSISSSCWSLGIYKNYREKIVRKYIPVSRCRGGKSYTSSCSYCILYLQNWLRWFNGERAHLKW